MTMPESTCAASPLVGAWKLIKAYAVDENDIAAYPNRVGTGLIRRAGFTDGTVIKPMWTPRQAGMGLS